MISDLWTIDFHGQASSQPLFHNEGTFVGLPCQKSLSVLTQFNPIFSIKTNRCQNYLKYVPRVVYIAAAFFTEREGGRESTMDQMMSNHTWILIEASMRDMSTIPHSLLSYSWESADPKGELFANCEVSYYTTSLPCIANNVRHALEFQSRGGRMQSLHCTQSCSQHDPNQSCMSDVR